MHDCSNRWMLFILWCAATLAVATSAHAQQAVRPPGATWTLTLPPSWKLAPQSVVDQMNADEADPDDPSFKYLVKFDPADGLGVGYPYIAVQYSAIENIASASWNDLLELTGGDTLDAAALSKPLGEVIPSLAPDTRHLDQTRAAMLLWYDEPGAGPSGRTLRGVHVGYFTTSGLLELVLLDKAEENNRYLGDLTRIAASFRLDPGEAFTPGPGWPGEQPPTRSRRSGGFRLPMFGLLGLGGLGGVGVLTLLVRRILQADD